MSLTIHLSNVIDFFSLSNKLSIILLCSSMMYSHLLSEHSLICCSMYIDSSILYLVLNILLSSNNFDLIVLRSVILVGIPNSSSSNSKLCFSLILIIFSLILIQSIISNPLLPLIILLILRTTLIKYFAKLSVLSSSLGLLLLFVFFLISDGIFLYAAVIKA